MSSRVLILIFLMILIPISANAADSANDFEVELLPAEGQQSFSEGYFNVDAGPGQQITLNFRLTNTSDEPIELNAETVDAWTAETGGILYSANADLDEEDHPRLTDLLIVQETIKIPANTVEIVHYHFDVPWDASGTLLGGIMLTTANNSQELSMEPLNDGGSNYTFEQLGQQLVAVKVNMPENSAAGFSLGKAQFDSSQNLLTMKVANGNSTVLENVQGTYTIMDKDGETILNGVIDSFAMAPKSDIRFPVDLKGHVFEEGKYVLLIKGSADKKEFFAEEKFSVSGTPQAAFASEATAPEASGGNFLPAIAISLAALFLLLLLFMKIVKRNEKGQYMNLTDKNNLQ
ncbi:WxL protein peptidoglycan domain-containing protein [Metaplanococcus flavidus]|uniref:WxL protein peptidoglycan domain-containing protein n=1 Tax=Metaplanococcus flavidus TaxID=569883 RepID=A0ABW3LAE9_9BACL